MAHMLELRKVSKYYSDHETVNTGFSRVDLKLDMGEFVAITGESGGGKSTLLNVLSGLDSYEEGELYINGENTSGYKTEDYERYRKKYIGNIFQDFNLVNSYTVYQNIELSMLMLGKTKKECKERILELIDLVGLTKYRRTKASRLSGGQKQRVAIARALAKDAPIIVADEPTGNLDSESASKVLETLYKISQDKLVIVVTHNYEQVEQYVTRKLTMHDGRLIEDKQLRPNRLVEASRTNSPALSGYDAQLDAERRAEALFAYVNGEAYEDPDEQRAREMATNALKGFGDMKKTAELRLGARNTFNLPTKFILLLIVYFFVSTAVLSQYASTKQTIHANDMLGTNEYFTNTDTTRMVVKKADKSAFTEEDLTRLGAIDGVDYVVKNDPALDSGIYLESDEVDVTGVVYPSSILKESDLTYGTLPQGDNDVVIKVNQLSSGYDSVKGQGEALIGKEYPIASSNSGERLAVGNVRIAGVIIDKHSSDPDNLSGSGWIYTTDALSNQILVQEIASLSNSTVNYEGKNVKSEGVGQVIFPNANVPEGKAFIFESQSVNYKDAKWQDKPITLSVSNLYFDSSIALTVGDCVTNKNITKLLGYSKDEYDQYSYRTYVNPADFQRLFNQGNFQISVFAKDEESVDTVLAEIKDAKSNSVEATDAGANAVADANAAASVAPTYTAFALKDSLSDITGGFSFIMKMLQVLSLAIEFTVLFFIAYAVIRLIMRSRNSYYSTLRILGASRKNTDNILRIELVFMMLIAFALDVILIILSSKNIIDSELISDRLQFLTLRDYIVLLLGLAAMSLLIAKRYSRKIFSKSAMNVYREEA